MKLSISVAIAFILLIKWNISFAQSISPEPGNSTICPGEAIVYTVNPNPNFAGCGSFTWTITNGTFVFGQNITSKVVAAGVFDVTVFWSDVAGNGTLTVTSTCSEGTLSVSKTYAIRSLAGRVPQNIRKNPNLNLCETTSVRVFIDVMFLENTGGFTNIQPQQRADGYEWVLPTGWTHNGSATTPVRTVEEFIDITPIDGCKGGSITVKAFKNCTSGRKYSASSASLSLNRPIGTILRVQLAMPALNAVIQILLYLRPPM